MHAQVRRRNAARLLGECPGEQGSGVHVHAAPPAFKVMCMQLAIDDRDWHPAVGFGPAVQRFDVPHLGPVNEKGDVPGGGAPREVAVVVENDSSLASGTAWR